VVINLDERIFIRRFRNINNSSSNLFDGSAINLRMPFYPPPAGGLALLGFVTAARLLGNGRAKKEQE
jgi:hypothetical protein